MTKFERWFLMRVFKKQLAQGPDHFDNLKELYRMIRHTWRKEFNEDNLATHEFDLREAHEAEMVTTRVDTKPILPDSFPIACYDITELKALGYTLNDCVERDLKGTTYYSLKKDIAAELEWSKAKFGER